MNESLQAEDIEAEAKAVMEFLTAIAEASHNVVLLHIVKSLSPLLEQNVLQNLKLLSEREDALQKLNEHRAKIVNAIVSGEPEKASEMSHTHLAFIDETLSDLTQEQGRRARSLRRTQQNKQ
ncbi:transcriptional repressor [Vibrio sp. JCM 19236]|nr:transcriptional repressor [Vibrio sp. JCM 19236]